MSFLSRLFSQKSPQSQQPSSTPLAAAYTAECGRAAPAAAAGTLSQAEQVAAGWSYGEMRYAYLDLGQAQVAVGYFERALAAGRAMGARRLEAAGLNYLGLAYAPLGEGQRAIGYYEQALVTSRALGDRWGEGAILGNLGTAYFQMGEARRAIGYYEQALAILRKVGDRRNEGAALGNIGSAYLQLGDARRALGYYEQRLEIAREIGDAVGLATVRFNMAQLYALQGEAARALPLARQAAETWGQIGHAGHTQQAQELVVQLEGSRSTISAGPTRQEILQQFASLIAEVVAAAHGDRLSHAVVEQSFDMLTRNGWHIAEPIQRIWAGERDEAALTASLNASDTLVVRAILAQLGN